MAFNTESTFYWVRYIKSPSLSRTNEENRSRTCTLDLNSKSKEITLANSDSRVSLSQLFNFSLNRAQLQRTAWFYLGLFFGRRGVENQRQLTPAMLSLRKTPEGVEYFEPNRCQPGSLPATKKKTPGRPRRCWRWIGCENIFRHRIWKMSSKNAQDLLGLSQSNVRCSVSETKRWSKQEVQSRRRQNLVLQRTSWYNYAPQHDERDVKASRCKATSHKPLPESYICHNAIRP